MHEKVNYLSLIQGFFLLASCLLFVGEVNGEAKIVCYTTNWSIYRTGIAKFSAENINPLLCTHLIYAYSKLDNDRLVPFDSWQDIDKKGYYKFNNLKTMNPDLKTILALGGSTAGSRSFSPMVSDPEKRGNAVKNIVKYLREHKFDGIDLVWNYPTRSGGQPSDKENYSKFVEELRTEIDRESAESKLSKLLLTVAIPQHTDYIDQGYEIGNLNKNVDWFHVLAYNYLKENDTNIPHISAINGDGERNLDYIVRYYINIGADREKLVITIPTYAQTFTLTDENSTDVGSLFKGPGEAGLLTQEKGQLAYYELCQKLQTESNWTIIESKTNTMGPYAFKGDQWVSYDNEESIKKKAEYVNDNLLGGLAFWSIDEDDFRGICFGKPFPLVEAAKEKLN